MIDDKAHKFYDGVYDQTCIPWYFVGCIHGIEAYFDFRKHLHNGDPLSRQTTHVPPGRPKPWAPPTDWSISAVDALSMKNYDKETSWGLAETLYRWERYNGWRSRLLHNINTPYLWSYSNHYTKGKYYADDQWDPNYVSKQPGTAVILKALIEIGKVPPIA
jgi:lysozyme family protein